MPLSRLWNAIRNRAAEHPAGAKNDGCVNTCGLSIDWSAIDTVVEIGVRRGSNLGPVLAGAGKPIRYVAIDPFESRPTEDQRPGDLTLMEFHRQMRAIGLRITVDPEPVEDAVARIARTVGRVDLIAIDAAQIESTGIFDKIERIAHSQTTIAVHDEGRWNIRQTGQNAGPESRAA